MLGEAQKLCNGVKREKKSVIPEIGWSQLRHWFTPGFEDILDVGVNNGWYDPDILLEAKSLIHVATGSITPPNEQTGTKSFLTVYRPTCLSILETMIKVEQEAVDSVHALYGPKDHEIFQLVPPDFQAIITEMYVQLGQPPVTRESCWDVYLQLLDAEQSAELDRMLDEDEPIVQQDEQDDDTSDIFAWFSDEDFAEGPDVDES
ncbi:hypothetical protein DFH07DRAFT_1032206 [Mycena maculata]|uniref:Uncharacterized protein n=1 Tax=Mycena maculata TaxID=230809 RepID=A0AAD7NA61_9AGAR|nr:hypothetical protein DFH07DRAFT_1032206 [Mycena maculata]